MRKNKQTKDEWGHEHLPTTYTKKAMANNGIVLREFYMQQGACLVIQRNKDQSMDIDLLDMEVSQ